MYPPSSIDKELRKSAASDQPRRFAGWQHANSLPNPQINELDKPFRLITGHLQRDLGIVRFLPVGCAFPDNRVGRAKVAFRGNATSVKDLWKTTSR